MTGYIEKRHGNSKYFLLNLLLLGVVGVILIRLITVAVYIALPASYFLQIEKLAVEDVVQCTVEQVITGEVTRQIYPHIPVDVAKNRAIQTDITVELFKASGRKVDDLNRTPVIEWREDNKNQIEWDFNTTLIPGEYYIEATIYLVKPLVGKLEEPIRVRSNTFTIEPCKPIRANS